MIFSWNGITMEKVETSDNPVVHEVIPFYIPSKHKPKNKWVPPSQRGKILEFKPKDTLKI